MKDVNGCFVSLHHYVLEGLRPELSAHLYIFFVSQSRKNPSVPIPMVIEPIGTQGRQGIPKLQTWDSAP
jgi:hypothetical protein